MEKPTLPKWMSEKWVLDLGLLVSNWSKAFGPIDAPNAWSELLTFLGSTAPPDPRYSPLISAAKLKVRNCCGGYDGWKRLPCTDPTCDRLRKALELLSPLPSTPELEK